MDLVACDLQHRHGRECFHHRAILLRKKQHRGTSSGTLHAGFSARKNQARGKAFDVVLKRPPDRLIKIIDVEDQPAIERCKGPEIENVSIATQLRGNARVRMAGKIGAAPRKKPKGLATMRSYLIGMRRATRPVIEARKSASGSCLQTSS
jgi:hypothetical protein